MSGLSGGASGKTLLGRINANNTSPNVDFNSLIVAGMTKLRVECRAVILNTASNTLQMRFSEDNGATYLGGGRYWVAGNRVTDAGVNTAFGTSAAAQVDFPLGSTAAGNNVWDGYIDIFRDTQFAEFSGIIQRMSTAAPIGVLNQMFSGTIQGASVAPNAIRLTNALATNIISGEFSLYNMT